MAITCYGGFDGVPIPEPQFGTSISNWASQMGVVGAGDWQVTAGSNPGQLNIAPGTGWAHGVTAVSDSITSVIQSSLPTGTGATRWDLVATRRDWQPPGGTGDFVIVQGSSSQQLPAAAAAPGSTGRQVFPGIIHDQPLALVQWTSGYSKPTKIIDLRVWAANGGMVARDALVRTFLDQVGTQITISGEEWVRELDTNGSPKWSNVTTDPDAPGPWVNINAATDWTIIIGRCRKIARGTLLQIDLETKYTGPKTKLPTKAGWFIGKLPAGYKPANPQLVTGLMAQGGDGYLWAATCWVGPNDIQIANPSEGWTAFKIQALAALQ
jgi:hypothetical protein